jgi:hypothetical protein
MAARELSLSDPTFSAPARGRNVFERAALRVIRDERDLPFVWLSLQISLVLIPLAALLYVPGVFRWWMAPLYWAVLFGMFFDRYILMLHNTSHRPLFKREYGFLKFYIPWVLGPFCGESPETYFIHHITMHHAEGNLPRDLSSTMKYRRDSAVDFFRYWADFFFFSIFKLAGYQLRKKRPRLFAWMIAGELSFYTVVAIGLLLAPGPTLTVFVVPFLLCRVLMMCGNWGQHAFVDADDPGNSYRNSITCINTRYNRRCFNDGYHIYHHVKARCHWSEYPGEFQTNKTTYGQHDAIVFRGLDFFLVWVLLMVGAYRKLAESMVELPGAPQRSIDERIAFMRSRLQPIL